MIYVILALTLVAFGGFYMWVKCAAGLLIAVALLDIALKGKQKISIKQYTPVILLFLTFITTFWSVDASRNIEAVITGFVLLGWMLLCTLTDDKKLTKLMAVIPVGTALMTLVSLVDIAIELPIKLWQADRLGGFVQYSNTCALLLLLGLMIEEQVEDRNKYMHAGLIVINLAGILLTGSRSVILLTFAWMLYLVIVRKQQRKLYGAGIGITVIVVVIAAIAGIGTQNISRLTSLSLNSSTLWGRILYAVDGIGMLIRHPFGMGYMGYYYVQGSEQTGVYTTIFVHNDFLQMGLDYGVISMVLFVVYILYQIVKGRQARMNKEMLAVISVASLADFHLQYMIIAMIMIMCLDYDAELPIYKIKRKVRAGSKSDSTPAIIISFVAAVAAVYWLLVYGALGAKNYEMSYKMCSFNTQAMEGMMLESSDAKQAYKLADRITYINDYNDKAWLYKAYSLAATGDCKEAINCASKAVSLQKYNIAYYRRYDGILRDMSVYASDDDKERILAELKELPDRLSKLEESTGQIAYKIKDKPVFVY